jgi:hypothetical protein
MNFGSEFLSDEGIVRVSSEFVVEYFTGGDGDGFQDISGHEENN